MLSSNPILLNQDSKEYSSSSTLAIKILVSPLLHCRRCYGATYRISSSEHGHFWPYTITYPRIGIRTPRQEKPLAATSSRPRPGRKVGRGASSHFLLDLTAASQPYTTSPRSHYPPTVSSTALHCRPPSQKPSRSPWNLPGS
jgi:hypothetical protein